MSFIKRSSNKHNPPRATVVLTTQKNEYEPGEEVKGEIQIISEEEFDTEKVAVSLSCWENLKKTRTVFAQLGQFGNPLQEQYWDEARIYLDSFIVFNAARIPQGFNKKYPFTLKIPSVARETLYSIDNNVKWWVQTTTTVKGRPRLDTQSREIIVAKQQSATSVAPVISKETIREVVLIPCAYCGGLMPQTSLYCPNCGARRRT